MVSAADHNALRGPFFLLHHHGIALFATQRKCERCDARKENDGTSGNANTCADSHRIDTG